MTYDLPSSLMSGLKNEKVTAAAKKLDAKLIALGVHASGAQAERVRRHSIWLCGSLSSALVRWVVTLVAGWLRLGASDLLVRPSRAKQLSQDGLRIISPHGDAVLSPKLISADKIDTPYDIIFLSVKAYALEAAMNDFAAAVGPETIIFRCSTACATSTF